MNRGWEKNRSSRFSSPARLVIWARWDAHLRARPMMAANAVEEARHQRRYAGRE
jgi:hypothetical protein